MSHPFPGDDPKDRLEAYEFQMGPQRAKLALAMDLLTDALIVLGQHKVYTHPNTGLPKRDKDIEGSIQQLEHVKKLLTAALDDKR